ncbi:Os10g0430800 [Oryza sativa Japonica Group]|nr:Os10g0430800 [Oryza sativa Japonica Group]|eukprot:NP_001064662.1 Os10g0430800 [Oryza sativa Japonica Group]
MVMQQVQVLKEVSALLRGKETPVILDLEESLRAKGDMTQGEEVKIYASKVTAVLCKAFATATSALVGYHVLGVGAKLLGNPPLPRIPRIGMAAGSAWIVGKFAYYTALQASPIFILEGGEERMKMELANIILTKHNDEKTLVEAVKQHFFAEHLFSDQYQDMPLFRWRLRHTYVDSTFMERVKEIEVKNSSNGSGSISGHRTTNTRSFGDLMEDPLACILGSPDGDIENKKSAENTGTIVKRREDYPSDFQSQATDRSRFSGMNISVHEQNEFHRDV